MPQIGWFEILLIVVISILVIGPKDYPIMLKKLVHGLVPLKNILMNFKAKFHCMNTKVKKRKI